MSTPIPTIGSDVHFVYGDEHVPAKVINPTFWIEHPGGAVGVTQSLAVFSLDGGFFTTTAECDPAGRPATWHWPESA